MKDIYTVLVVASAFSLMAADCHTSPWEPVADEIEGTWTLQPVEPNYIEQWTFANGQLTISINGFFLQFDKDGTTQNSLGYHVDNLITNHYLVIDNLPTTNGQYHIHETIARFLFISSDANEFFISSETTQGLKGGWQFHFFRI
jgi:hypothetical protein